MGKFTTKSLATRRSAEDLVRRLGHALDIARQAVDRLAATGYADPREPANNLRPEKVIAETAFLLLCASRAGEHPEVRERIGSLAERLIPYARGERMVLGVCLEPALALDYAQAHICLARLGYPDPGFDSVLRRSVDSQARAGRERPPHRELEQHWLEEIWDGSRSNSHSKLTAAARNSVLGRPMDLLSSSRDNVYAFTHALMYVTDCHLPPRQLPRPVSVILAEAEAALGRCLDDQDYDLGGEVLLAWPLTGRPWSAAAAFGFRVLARVEDEAGFLPSPSTKLQRLNELKGDERSNYLLATVYHTAYVMGLVCAVALSREKRRPPKSHPAGSPPGAPTESFPSSMPRGAACIGGRNLIGSRRRSATRSRGCCSPSPCAGRQASAILRGSAQPWPSDTNWASPTPLPPARRPNCWNGLPRQPPCSAAAGPRPRNAHSAGSKVVVPRPTPQEPTDRTALPVATSQCMAPCMPVGFDVRLRVDPTNPST